MFWYVELVSEVSSHLSVILCIVVYLKINKQNYDGATEIKRRLNSGNACYHSVQNLLSSCLLSNNIKLDYTKL
jgi:hypothetical protein